MEIKKYISDLKISLLSNSPIALKQSNHEDAFIESVLFVLKFSKPLWSDEIYILLKEEIDFGDLSRASKIVFEGFFSKKKYYKYSFSIEEFDSICEKILKSIYYLNTHESMFCSEKLYISMCTDPICVDFYFGEDKRHMNEIRKHFFDRF